ncbi:nuclear transport factor 2 family protein [Sinomicrobium sp. M5D2P9]
MRRLIIVLAGIFLVCGVHAQNQDTKDINTLLDAWHKAAADVDFDRYFGYMTSDAVFIGTDATENWKGKEFRDFARPYFERGKAWNFTALERNVYVGAGETTAWFDELLDTQMKICRGSGVLVKQDGDWKIRHYVLSIAVPNDDIPQLIEIKKDTDDKLMDSLRQKG